MNGILQGRILGQILFIIGKPLQINILDQKRLKKKETQQ